MTTQTNHPQFVTTTRQTDLADTLKTYFPKGATVYTRQVGCRESHGPSGENMMLRYLLVFALVPQTQSTVPSPAPGITPPYIITHPAYIHDLTALVAEYLNLQGYTVRFATRRGALVVNWNTGQDVVQWLQNRLYGADMARSEQLQPRELMSNSEL